MEDIKIKTGNKLLLHLLQTRMRALYTDKSAQLLVEILIAMAVGGILIVGASIAMLSVVRTNNENRQNQIGASMAKDLIQKIESYAANNWSNISNRTRGVGSYYFLSSSSSLTLAVSGQEGILANDVSGGVVHHWRFDESAGLVAYDASGNGNNGSLVGSSTRQTAQTCRVGGCLLFNGTNSYVTNNPTLVPTSTQGAITFWMNIAEKDRAHGIFHLYENSAQDYVRSYIGTNNRMDLIIEDDDSARVNVYFDLDDLGDFANQWYHIAWVQNGSAVKLFINGEEKTLTGTNSGAWWTAHLNTPLTFRTGYGWAYLKGSLDDVRIYNRALSKNEIETLYGSMVFMRSFSIEDVVRDRCGSGSVTTTATTTCVVWDGIAPDPSTLKITARIESSDGRFLMSVPTFVTRTQNISTRQKGWLQDGVVGPVVDWGVGFASSSDVTMGESIRSQSTSTTGIVYSSILDTERVGGATFNTLWWRGTPATGGRVRFQIASSNSSSTSGWSFIGPGGTSLSTDYYEPIDAQKPARINTQYHSNHRFFRYKLLLVPETATTTGAVVDDVMVNWSP